MSALNNDVIHYELDNAKKSGVMVTYPAFLEWICSNQLETATFEETKDFLAYLGLIMFDLWREKYPDLTLNDLALSVFHDTHAI